MRKTLLILLVLSSLLVVDTEARGWFRKLVKKAKDFVDKAVDVSVSVCVCVCV